VRAVSPTGGGTVWLVSASGIAHGVADADTATALGLPPALPAAPEAALRLLPQGGRLDLADARRAVGS
jgi:predicted cobalt transporter CbtA